MSDRRLGHVDQAAHPQPAAGAAATARRTTERESRVSLKADVARALVRVLFEADVDQAEVASAVGVRASIVQRWADRSRPETISLADLVLAGERFPAVARGLLSWAADRLGLVVSERLVGEQPGDHLAQIARMGREHAEAVGVYLEAVSDGAVTDAELARIDKELTDAEEANAALRAWVESEKGRRAPLRAVRGGR